MYFVGEAAQARDSFATGRKNAASPQAVSGLGDDAYLDEPFAARHMHEGRCDMTLTALPPRRTASGAPGNKRCKR